MVFCPPFRSSSKGKFVLTKKSQIKKTETEKRVTVLVSNKNII